VEDSDHGQGNKLLDSLYLDHHYIQVLNSNGGAIPVAPDNLIIQSVSSSTVTLQWQDQSDDELGFYLERSLDQSSWSRILTLPADETQNIDTGLNQNQLYHYRIQAYNANGESGYSNNASATTDSAGNEIIHISDLDASSSGNKKWTAIVSALVTDQSQVGISGSVVTGSWSSGGSGSCTTDTNGQCSVTKRQKPSAGTDTFSVTSVSHNDYVYDASFNTDPDSDSNGTTITVSH
jgi:hypothetical protein